MKKMKDRYTKCTFGNSGKCAYMSDKKITFDDCRKMIQMYSPCMDDYPYIMDLKQDEYYISEKAVERFNVPSAFFTDAVKTHEQFVHKDDIQLLTQELEDMIGGKKNEHDITYRWLDHDKHTVWINCRGTLIKDEDGSPQFMIGCVNEVGMAAKADNNSGLLQSSEMKALFETAEIRDKIGFVLRVGIDGFKDINEKFGTQYGDFILKGVANCIVESLGENQSVYHAVGDEYLIVDCNGSSVEEGHELYRNIRRAIDFFIENNDYEAVYTISGGILSCKHYEMMSYEEIVKLSTFALQQAKYRGKNQLYIFSYEDYEKFLRKRYILTCVRKSVSEDFRGFETYFQPLMTAGDEHGKLYGAECLLRYETEKGERISPIDFIPILEESGLIIPVGRFVLEQAAQMCKKMQTVYPDFKVSINLSYVQILKSAILKDIFNILAKYGLKPESFVVEITESGYLENTPFVRRVWDSLKKIGILIALDDFGTGYSNLSSISNFSPDYVKLDRGFTVKALKNSYENTLMKHIIDLAHSVKLKIVIEGVETVEELDRLSVMEPDYVQGYYYSKPCSSDEFWDRYGVA